MKYNFEKSIYSCIIIENLNNTKILDFITKELKFKILEQDDYYNHPKNYYYLFIKRNLELFGIVHHSNVVNTHYEFKFFEYNNYEIFKDEFKNFLKEYRISANEMYAPKKLVY